MFSIKKIFVVGLIMLSLQACDGPLGPFPGGKLSGAEHTGVVESWSFASEIEVAQLESRPDDPHSINVWIGIVDDQLYIPSSLIFGAENPQDREWVQYVLADPRIRLRIEDRIYALDLERVMDTDTINKAKNVLLSKYAEETTEQTEQAWIFQAKSR